MLQIDDLPTSVSTRKHCEEKAPIISSHLSVQYAKEDAKMHSFLTFPLI